MDTRSENELLEIGAFFPHPAAFGQYIYKYDDDNSIFKAADILKVHMSQQWNDLLRTF